MDVSDVSDSDQMATILARLYQGQKKSVEFNFFFFLIKISFMSSRCIFVFHGAGRNPFSLDTLCYTLCFEYALIRFIM